MAKRRNELAAEKAKSKPRDADYSPYSADERGFFMETADGRKQISNFTAWIAEHRRIDDGTGRENPNEVLMHGSQGGKPLPPVTLFSEELVSTDWTKRSWSTTSVFKKDCTRIAIDTHKSFEAKHSMVRTHTGWAKIDGQPAYLHADGAIMAEGLRNDVKVEAGGALREDEFKRIARLRLPAPPRPDELEEAARTSLAFLEVGPYSITAPIFAMTYLPPLGAFLPLSVTGYIYGDFNAFKTALVGIAQSHYGAFDREALPFSFHGSTPTGAEILAFTMKDALMGADDFRLSGLTKPEVARRTSILERLVRSSGDHAGGARATKDLRLRKDMPPRALTIVTAETKIAGASTNTRMALVRVSSGDIKLGDIIKAAEPEKRRLYALSMSGYLQWIARNWTALERTIAARTDELMREFGAVSAFARQPRNAALLMVGIETALAFMLEAGAIAFESALEIRSRAEREILGRMVEEAQSIEEQDAPRLFIECLASALSANNDCYVETLDGKEPPNPRRWGWRPELHNVEGQIMTRPRTGVCVGRIDPGETNGERRLYLDEKVAFRVVRRFHQELHGGEFPVSADTLWNMLAERKLVDVTVEKRGATAITRPRVRKRMPAEGEDVTSGSARPWVVALRMDVFEAPELSGRGGDNGDTTKHNESNESHDSGGVPKDPSTMYARVT